MNWRRFWKPGRLLVFFTVGSVMFAPLTADLNETHVFNPAWPPHARFHAMVMVLMSIGLTLTGWWLIWKRSSDHATCMTVAAIIPLLAWASFFPAALVPGAGLEDHPDSLPRVVGMPLNLFMAGLMVMLTLLGYWLYWRQEGRSLRETVAMHGAASESGTTRIAR